jgi:hypothetical protein
MSRNDLKCLFSLALLVVGFAILLPGGTVFALNPQPLPPGLHFGLFTLQPGQTARINVANLGSSSSEEPPDPCVVLVLLVDQNGSILNGNGQGQTLTMGPGNSANVEYPPAATTVTALTTTAPVQVRGVVLSLTPLPFSCAGGKSEDFERQVPCGHWVFTSSLEIVDSTGSTLLILNPLERFMLNPQPLPPG